MSNLLKSKFLLGVMTVAIMFVGVVALGGANTASADCTVVPTLRLGSTGDSVVCLQTKLNLTADGKFGPMTEAAVKAFQTSKTLTADGVVGPMTAAALNAVVGGGSGEGALCPNGHTVASSCTTGGTAGGPTCPNGNLISNNCLPGSTGGNTGGLTGGAADIVLSNYSSGTNKTVNEGQSEKVAGFKLEATGGDVAVTNLKVTMMNLDTDSSYNISKYVDSVDIYAGSKKVATVNASDFIKNNATSSVCGADINQQVTNNCYTASVAIPNSVVKMGSNNKVAFNVKVNAASSVDSNDALTNNWLVAVSDIRFADSTGMVLVSSAYDIVTGVKFTKLSLSGDAKLTVSRDNSSPSNPTSVTVSDTSTTPDILLLAIKMKATGTDMSFDNLTVSLDGTFAHHNAANLSSMIDSLELRNGSDVLASDPTIPSGQSGDVVFALDNTYTIQAGDSQVFDVYMKAKRIDVPNVNYFVSNDGLSVSFANDGVTVEDPSGDKITNKTGSATGEVQTFFVNGAVISKVSSSSAAVNQENTSRDFTLVFDVTAIGQDLTVDRTSLSDSTTTGVQYSVNGAVNVNSPSLTSTASLSGDIYTVYAGQTKRFTLTVNLGTGTTGQKYLVLEKVGGVPTTSVIESDPATVILH